MPATPPESFSTLIEMLECRALETPGKAAFDFMGVPVTYGEMWRGINRFADHLKKLGISRGDHVIVVIPNSPAFFEAFYGVQRAGGIAVPLFPGFGADVLQKYAQLCQARVIVAASREAAGLIVKSGAGDGGSAVISTTVEDAGAGDLTMDFPAVEPDDIAFIQYTSGSTGDPKGVQISHRNLLTNMRQMIVGMEITGNDIFVSWLPVYHDMGLILKTMVPFYLGLDLHLLATDLRDVSLWLEAIQYNRATFTAAPDFAYRLCLRQIAEPSNYDLSSLRLALNAAEPVRRRTIEEFENAFRVKNVMTPAYGLAEATVGVCTWPPNRPRKVDNHGHVSVGKPFPGVEMVIVEDGKPATTGRIGEIAIKSDAMPAGYLNNEAANAALWWKPGYMLSGDLGYVDEEGDYFIVGRKKNTINQAGRTIHTQEIEEIADGVENVRYAVALGIDRGRLEGEQVYIFAEIRQDRSLKERDHEGIVRAMVRRIQSSLGFRPGRIYLVKPKTIPMTYNGKFQHQRLRQLYLDGTLRKRDMILYPDY